MDDEHMDVRVSSGCVPGPGGGEAARILARMVADPLAGYVRLARKYGDVVRVPITPRRGFFLLARPEHAEHVLAANQDNYVKAFTYRPLRALVGDGLLTTEGEQWRRHRRLAQPVFSRREVTGFGPHMTAGARRLVRRWDGLADGPPVNVAREMSALTLEIVGHALFGADLTGDADELSRAISVGQQAVALTALLPITWGPASTRMVRSAARRIGRTPEGVEGPAGRLIAARRANGHADRAPADLLDVLFGARDEDGSPLTDTEIGDEVATFMLAGHETTANALSWSLALLSAFPRPGSGWRKSWTRRSVTAIRMPRTHPGCPGPARWCPRRCGSTRPPGRSSGTRSPTTTSRARRSRREAWWRSRRTWCTATPRSGRIRPGSTRGASFRAAEPTRRPGTVMRSSRSAAASGPASALPSPNWRPCWCSPPSPAVSGSS
jgi:Cytochrome P450